MNFQHLQTRKILFRHISISWLGHIAIQKNAIRCHSNFTSHSFIFFSFSECMHHISMATILQVFCKRTYLIENVFHHSRRDAIVVISFFCVSLFVWKRCTDAIQISINLLDGQKFPFHLFIAELKKKIEWFRCSQMQTISIHVTLLIFHVWIKNIHCH